MLPVHRETLPSFLSRLAASKGVATPEFAQDLAGSFKRLVQCDPEAVAALTAWTKLSDEALDDLLSWTGVAERGVRTRFRGELVISRALRNPVVEGCPVCLREDGLANPSAPLAAMALRGQWQLREVTVCLRHRKSLVPLWDEGKPLERFDIQRHLGRLLERILDGTLDGPMVDVSDFDLWLDARLDGHPDPSWLAPIGTSAVARFCSAYGEGLTRTEPSPSDAIRRRHQACAAGFEIVRHGPEMIADRLKTLPFDGDGWGDTIKKRFGRFLFALDTHMRADPEMDIFRDILREAVLDVWPVEAGELVFGVPVTERRLHSVASAAAGIGVDGVRLRPLLVEAGALEADDPRPDARATFDARRFAPLLDDITRRVDQAAMRRALGASPAELGALEKDGILRPRTALPNARLRWHLSDAVDLLGAIQGKVTSSAARADDIWLPIHRAHTRTGTPVGRIVSAVCVGEIAVRQAAGESGYGSFCVALAEVRSLLDVMDEEAGEGATLLAGNSLAEFGREIGIRDMPRLVGLVEAKVMPARIMLNPRTRRTQWRLSREAMAGFRQRYLTLGMILAEFGVDSNTSRAWLTAGGAAPITVGGQVFAGIYPRAQIEDILRKHGAVRRPE
ncbi:TniQ family protein [Falsirhodobacter deserti]|uniref:TniQ family protein n=1 Tax=Falsirhodobacter deserti TaxID=1365611 RepID=UPI000FE3D71C|nr:TniQ family protein [Falsirhodobacter deserti]